MALSMMLSGVVIGVALIMEVFRDFVKCIPRPGNRVVVTVSPSCMANSELPSGQGKCFSVVGTSPHAPLSR